MRVDWEAVENATDHRPWPRPERPWVMTMSWLDLLLAHWPVDPEVVAGTLPEGLDVDTWEGDAWLTVVPFVMANTGPRWGPSPLRSFRFLELNLRTYVDVGGSKPGVWFYSLDASSRLAVTGARTCFSLPYFLADMTIDRRGGAIGYTSRRTSRDAADGRFAAGYAPYGTPEPADDGSFAEWLTRRYCLYSADGPGRVYRADVQHRPWKLSEVEVAIEENSLDAGRPFEMEGSPVAAHYASRVDVLGWWPELVRSPPPAGAGKHLYS